MSRCNNIMDPTNKRAWARTYIQICDEELPVYYHYDLNNLSLGTNCWKLRLYAKTIGTDEQILTKTIEFSTQKELKAQIKEFIETDYNTKAEIGLSYLQHMDVNDIISAAYANLIVTLHLEAFKAKNKVAGTYDSIKSVKSMYLMAHWYATEHGWRVDPNTGYWHNTEENRTVTFPFPPGVLFD